MPKKKTQTKIANKPTTDEEKVLYIQQCKKEADDASLDRRNAWKELWSLFQGKQDYKAKMDWQAKVFVPKLWQKIEKAAAEIKRAFIQIDKLFKLVMDDDYAEDLDEERLKQAKEEGVSIEKRFKSKISKSNLGNVYSEACKSGFLLGLFVPKVLWDSEKKHPKYENTDIMTLSISPDFKPFQEDKPKHVVEEQKMNLAVLKRVAKKVNEESGEEIYKMDVLDTIEEDFKNTEAEQKRRRQTGLSKHTPVSKEVLLWQFWGDILPKEGDDITENQLVVVANKRYIIREQDNPFVHSKPPYTFSFPLVYPHRGIAGISLVEPTAKLLYVYNNVLNMFVDNLNFTVNKMYTFNPNLLMNPANVLTVYPGKTIPVTGDNAIKEVVTSPAFREAIMALDTLGREIDEGTMVTEFLTSMPSKKTKTLGEIEIKTAESKGMFDTIARDLEKNSIKPILEMSYSLCVQFDGFPEIEGKYVFKVGGLSLLLMQKEQVEKIMQIMAMALKSPQLEKITDIGDLWKKLLSIYNLSDVYTEEESVSPETTQDIESGAVKDAKAAVARFGPEEAVRRMEQQRKAG